MVVKKKLRIEIGQFFIVTILLKTDHTECEASRVPSTVMHKL